MTAIAHENRLDQLNSRKTSKDLCERAWKISRIPVQKRTPQERQELSSIHRVLEDRHDLTATMDRFAVSKAPINNWTEVLIGAIPLKDRS